MIFVFVCSHLGSDYFSHLTVTGVIFKEFKFIGSKLDWGEIPPLWVLMFLPTVLLSLYIYVYIFEFCNWLISNHRMFCGVNSRSQKVKARKFR